MSRFCTSVHFVFLAVGGLLSAGPAFAASQPSLSPAPALPGAQPPGANRSNQPEPALPGAKTPADTFRELLAMSPAERQQALTNRSEFNRKYLEARLREYEALPAQERNLRLKQLELNCHLPALMKMVPGQRSQRLALVPADLRPLIEERLQQWDLLPAEVQREVLEYQTTANYFLRVRAGSGPSSALRSGETRPPLPGADMPRKGAESFRYFFELPAKEQEKTLDALAPKERESMEKTLQLFAKLPPEQRQTCINSFLKFRQMSKGQREQFLKNAERWKAMSPGERETWRTLVKILPPTSASPELPPLPKAPETPGRPSTASTQNESGLSGK